MLADIKLANEFRLDKGLYEQIKPDPRMHKKIRINMPGGVWDIVRSKIWAR